MGSGPASEWHHLPGTSCATDAEILLQETELHSLSLEAFPMKLQRGHIDARPKDLDLFAEL